ICGSTGSGVDCLRFWHFVRIRLRSSVLHSDPAVRSRSNETPRRNDADTSRLPCAKGVSSPDPHFFKGHVSILEAIGRWPKCLCLTNSVEVVADNNNLDSIFRFDPLRKGFCFLLVVLATEYVDWLCDGLDSEIIAELVGVHCGNGWSVHTASFASALKLDWPSPKPNSN